MKDVEAVIVSDLSPLNAKLQVTPRIKVIGSTVYYS